MCRFLGFFVFIFSVGIINLLGQGSSLNAKLLSNVPFSENSSGAWGYEKDGIKYALIGLAKKTSIFSLEDPKKPILRYSADGVQSIWRELRGYKNHIYVSIDQGQDGVTIIDMTKAPETITHLNFKPRVVLGSDTITLNTCHNLFIDEKGFLYLTGCNVGVRGVLIYDLNDNPNNPTFKGMINTEYSHDVFVRRDTLFSSEIYKGLMTLYDVSDKANPKFIVSQTTSRNFTHNIWPSDNGKYAFTTDERGGAFVDAYDISDLTNIHLLDKYRTVNGETDNTIPHNAYYYNGYLVVSYYTDGVRVLDVHKPDNMIEVAYYDTWESPTSCHNGFSGCWGVFPYTGSNIVYASDINNGLYIIDFDYKRACYLEGKITDPNGVPVNNVNVQIVSDQINKETSDITGNYKTGQVLNGTFKVRFTHPNYQTVEADAILENGKVTILDIVMRRRIPVNTSISVQADGKIEKANIVLINDFKDENRFATASSIPTNKILNVSDYEVYVTKWGFKNLYLPKLSVLPIQDNKFEFSLEKGYADNFETDLGWTVSSTTNTAGAWTRAIPREVLYTNGQISNPGTDGDDQGTRAYVTGNGLPGAACDDVDNGVTSLISPPMLVKGMVNPKLNYDVWFYNGGSAPLNDTLVIKLKNNEKEVIVDKIFSTADEWLKIRDFEIEKFIGTQDSIQLVIEASDLPGSGHIVEAGFDNFFITASPSSNEDIALPYLNVYPNPSQNSIIVRTHDFNQSAVKSFEIIDGIGRSVSSGVFDFHTFRIDVSSLATGMYLLKVDGFSPTKFIKI